MPMADWTVEKIALELFTDAELKEAFCAVISSFRQEVCKFGQAA